MRFHEGLVTSVYHCVDDLAQAGIDGQAFKVQAAIGLGRSRFCHAFELAKEVPGS